MRIAFIADVHANLPALEAVIADAREHGATHLLCLGDIVGYGPQPVETLARLREVASGVLMGNHDAAAAELLDLQLFNPFARETAERAMLALDDESKQYLRNLPYMLEVKNIACAHGCFDAPETFRYLENESDAARSLAAMPNFTLLVVGHTHIPCLFEQDVAGTVRKLPVSDLQLQPGHRYVVNPGSVGFPRTDGLTANYLIYDTLMRRLVFRSLVYDLAPYRLTLVRNGYNPLNYWFLSPEARQRQTELALRNPAPEKAQSLHTNSPFKPIKARSHISPLLIICMTLLAGLVVGVTLVLKVIHSTPQPPPREHYYNPNNLLPPLHEWTLSTHIGVTHTPETNTLQFHPTGDSVTYQSVHSPLIDIPEGCDKFKLSFRALAAQKQAVGRYEVYVEFIDQSGNRKQDRPHKYKRPGDQAYTVRVIQGATALRVCFNFKVNTPLKLQHPELERVSQ